MLGLRLIARQVLQTTSREALLLLVVFWGFLWAHLVNHLRIEWTVNPQYGYGWAVPLLCAYLIWQRISKSEIRNQKSGPPNPRSQTPDANLVQIGSTIEDTIQQRLAEERARLEREAGVAKREVH